MTENEKLFIKNVVDYDSNIIRNKMYIEETYNVTANFDEETGMITLESDNPENVILAKAYINENLDNLFTINE